MNQSEKRLFGEFDPAREIRIRARNLPHWSQAETAAFVTFRAIDSLPRFVISPIERQLREWLLARGLPLRLANLTTGGLEGLETSLIATLSPAEKRSFLKLKSQLLHRSLDECHGACHLNRSELRGIVAESLMYYDGAKYDLDCFVVMPNHVHAIVQASRDVNLDFVGQSWMRFTARKINKTLGASGAFWQPEPFDHLIRSEEQLQYLRKYIADNPVKANLSMDSFFFWKRD